jgi:hypothetical protein
VVSILLGGGGTISACACGDITSSYWWGDILKTGELAAESKTLLLVCRVNDYTNIMF